MIKSFTATTREIDDTEAAVAEIKNQLDPDNRLLKNSIGIISCFSEFEESGVLKAICDALPFECVGASTCLCAGCGEIDQVLFVITVLTSDDCSFKTAVAPISEKYEESIESALSNLMDQGGVKPALILTYLPLIPAVSGDMMIEVMDRITGGLPLFGAMAIDHYLDYHSAGTIYKGKMIHDALSVAAIYGNPKFTFEVASFLESRTMSQRAIITESKGNILMGVNGIAPRDYFKQFGMTDEELSIGMSFLPLVVDHKDGTKPIARAVFAITPEGYAVCGGVMPANRTLTLASIDRDDVADTTENILKTLAAKDSALFSYSCLARYLTLGMNNKDEAEKVKEAAKESPYIFAYTGGEICPLPDANGKLKNIFHNYTNVFCLLS